MIMVVVMEGARTAILMSVAAIIITITQSTVTIAATGAINIRLCSSATFRTIVIVEVPVSGMVAAVMTIKVLQKDT